LGRYLIDTSTLVALERGQLEPSALPQGDVMLSAVTASELLHGVHRAAGKPAVKAKRQAFVERLLAQLPVVPFDLVTARVHAKLWAELAEQGVLIGDRDLIIAATALSVGASIVTRNERHFGRVPSLDVLRV